MFRLIKPVSLEEFEFPTMAEVEEKIIQLKAELLEQESYRFTVVKVTLNGEDATWTPADLVNDPEENNYLVFNMLTGLHETCTSLSSAKNRHEAVKLEFLNSLDFLVKDTSQPTVTGAETL